MKHIFIIDDDIHINDFLDEVLTGEGYRVSHAYSGTEALLFLQNSRPDLILLDLMLPGLSGEELLPLIEDVPVIVVSAKGEIREKVSLLLNGAADYVTKPFDTDELLARITVQLRGRKTYRSGIIEYDDISMDTDKHMVYVSGKPVRLTKTEFAILKILMENPSQVITKSVLLDRIAESTPDCMESSLRVHVSNLRRKLREISGKEYIEAVWGIGFKMAGE